MAAATLSAPAVDLNAQTTFPLRLGASILKPAESKQYTSIRYNHKPRSDAAKSVKGSIRPQGKDQLELELKDGSNEYKYRGKNVDGQKHDRYVLIPRGSGKDREMVLERLTGCTAFNLEGPLEGKTRVYRPLPEDDLSDQGQDVDDGPADSKNPFDYRHYLGEREQRPRQSAATTTTATAMNGSRLQETPAAMTPIARPSKRADDPLVSQQKKRKAQDAPKPNPKRVKAGAEPPPKASPVQGRPDIPTVRLDRKASVRPFPTEVDDGELVLEDENTVQEKPKTSMALALGGHLGPISLHSAASSPASRVASPATMRPKDVEGDEEFEFGGSDAESPPQQTEGTHGLADGREDEDADADVEDFELPSPAQQSRVADVERREEEAVSDEDEDEEEDDDLDKQIALAMAEQDHAEDPPATVPAPIPIARDESDEESEEE